MERMTLNRFLQSYIIMENKILVLFVNDKMVYISSSGYIGKFISLQYRMVKTLITVDEFQVVVELEEN